MNKHLKVKKIEKYGKFLEIWIKGDYLKTKTEYEMKFGDGCYNFLHPYIDISQKYTILTFVLRNKKDIEPYLDYTQDLNSYIEKVLSKLAKQKEVLDKIKEYIKENNHQEPWKSVQGDYILELLEEIE